MHKETEKAGHKTALLVYCTQEEAQRIRLAARLERRTISGFVVNAVMTRLEVQARLEIKKKSHTPA